MRFHAQKVTAKANVARARLRVWPVNGAVVVDAAVVLALMSSPVSGGSRWSTAFAVARADAGPAGAARARARAPGVAGPVDDVGPEEVVQRRREGVHEPR